jgi:hypothetical protein
MLPLKLYAFAYVLVYMATQAGPHTPPLTVTQSDLIFFEQVTGFHGIADRILEENIAKVKE